MIVDANQIEQYANKLRRQNKIIVLVGGCFDILHIGHIKFLQQSKKHGNHLMVLLESDTRVKQLKGNNRPLFDQNERAETLAAIRSVDSVLLLPPEIDDKGYKNIIKTIQPSVVSLTEHDPNVAKKQEQALDIKAKLVIIPHFKTYSSSKLAMLLGIG
jgi:rfaE bifunctional protein nucleotidyltransferase chain/domain